MTRLLIFVASTALLSACGNGGSPLDSVPEAFADGSNPPVQVVSSESTEQLFDDTELTSTLPEIVMTHTLADSGIRIGFTTVDQVNTLDPIYIERQWQHMQSCTGQVAVAPLIVITEQAVTPLTNDDDVIFNIDGVPAASSSPGSYPSFRFVKQILMDHLGMSGSICDPYWVATCGCPPTSPSATIRLPVQGQRAEIPLF